MLKLFVKSFLFVIGWRAEGKPPDLPKYVMIGVPHTSNWDFLLMLSYMILHDMPMRWMAKASVFRWPFNGFFRRCGGVPIDRSQRKNMVEQMIALLASHDRVVVCVQPEGTRKYTEYWKSGFYYVALGAGVPIALTYMDASRKAFGMGPTVYPSGDIRKDMEVIAEFYRPIVGIRPRNQGPVRVKEAQ